MQQTNRIASQIAGIPLISSEVGSGRTFTSLPSYSSHYCADCYRFNYLLTRSVINVYRFDVVFIGKRHHHTEQTDNVQ